MLADLKTSAVGTVIYDQIVQVIGEHEVLRAKVDQTYGVLLHLLLDAYARNPTADSVTRLNAQLIQLRNTQSPPAPPTITNGTACPPVQSVAEIPTPPEVRPPAPVVASVSAPVPNTTTPAWTPPTAEHMPDPTEMITGASVQNERRVNT